jgi:putative phosphoribosyl transferase
VGAAGAIESLRAEVDELACLATPRDLIAVGAWYQDFRLPSEEDVVASLATARARITRARRAG